MASIESLLKYKIQSLKKEGNYFNVVAVRYSIKLQPRSSISKVTSSKDRITSTIRGEVNSEASLVNITNLTANGMG